MLRKDYLGEGKVVKSKFVCKLPLGNIFITERCLHLLIATLHTDQNLSRAIKRLEEVPLTGFDLYASSSRAQPLLLLCYGNQLIRYFGLQ